RAFAAAMEIEVRDDAVAGPVDHRRVWLAAIKIEELVAMQGEQMPLHPRLYTLAHLSPLIGAEAVARDGLVVDLHFAAKFLRFVEVHLAVQIQAGPLRRLEKFLHGLVEWLGLVPLDGIRTAGVYPRCKLAVELDQFQVVARLVQYARFVDHADRDWQPVV